MSYLKQRPGSVEEAITKLSSKVLESDYQDKFKKELEKTGKGIGSMSPAEKKAFFNKIDKMHTAKDEQATSKEIDKFHKKLDNLVHKSFGHSSDEKKMKKEHVEEIVEFTTQQIKMAYGVANDKRYKAGNYSGAVAAIEKIAKGLSKHPDVAKVLKRVNEDQELDETHMSTKKAQNQSQLDAKGEKEVVKPLSMKETVLKMWQEAAEKKDEKKKDATPPVDNSDEEPKKEEESVDKSKAEAEKAKDQVQLLKQKIEQEKTKQVQQRVNPETGEPLLQVGVAYKHLRDKMKKEEVVTKTDKKQEEEQNKNKKTTDTGEKPSEIETKPEIKYAN